MIIVLKNKKINQEYEMITRDLGSSGMQVSLVGYGGWKAGISGWTGASDRDVRNAVAAALDNGINFFDTAPVYGFGHSEEMLGKSLKKSRNRIYIATKVGLPWDDSRRVRRSLNPTSLLHEVENSLARLQTDYIDLLQVHWDDESIPAESIMKVLNSLKDEGKIRYIGVCNLSLKRLCDYSRYGSLASVQCYYNMLHPDCDTFLTEKLDYKAGSQILPWCLQNGAGFIPFSPLAQGFLADEWTPGEFSRRDVRRKSAFSLQDSSVRDRFLQIADQIGVTLSDLSLQWLAVKKEISTVIVGSTSIDHIIANCRAINDLSAMNDEVLRDIELARIS
jgi:aryl-alcohol dehydrogenase-like predicted oxidoreductase